jgi:hypothetical protein
VPGNDRHQQEAEALPHVLVSGHGQDQEENALLFQLRRAQEGSSRSSQVHPGALGKNGTCCDSLFFYNFFFCLTTTQVAVRQDFGHTTQFLIF